MSHLLKLPVLLILLGLCWSSWVYRSRFSSNLIISSIIFFALSLSSVLLGFWWLWIYIHCTTYVDPEVFKTVHSFLISFSDIISLIYLDSLIFFFCHHESAVELFTEFFISITILNSRISKICVCVLYRYT